MDDAFKGRFIETFLSPSVLEGKTYGLPIAASARAMYYNKDLLAKAGVENPPATWDELRAAATKIKALGGENYGFGLQGKEIETDVYYYYGMWSYGTEILNKDGTSGLSTPGALEAAKLYKSLIDDGLTQPGVTSYAREDVQNLFKQGKVGMMITAPFLSNQIKEEAPDLKYGVAAIPAGPTGARGTYGVTDSVIMFQNSKTRRKLGRCSTSCSRPNGVPSSLRAKASFRSTRKRRRWIITSIMPILPPSLRYCRTLASRRSFRAGKKLPTSRPMPCRASISARGT